MTEPIGDERRIPFFWITVTSTKLIRSQYRIETTAKGATRLVPRVDDDPGLSSVNAVYTAFVEIANEARVREATCATSGGFVTERAKVALYAGVSVKTVDRVVTFLERIALVAVERRRKQGSNENLPSQYTLVEPEPGGGDMVTPPSDTVTPGGGDMVTQNNSRRTSQEPPKAPPSEIEQVWAIYVDTMQKRGRGRNLGPGERAIIREALAAGDVEELRVCIVTCERSDYHMKRGKYADRQGQRYNSLGQILKPRKAKGQTQRSRIEWWAELAAEQAKAGPGGDSWQRFLDKGAA